MHPVFRRASADGRDLENPMVSNRPFLQNREQEHHGRDRRRPHILSCRHGNRRQTRSAQLRQGLLPMGHETRTRSLQPDGRSAHRPRHPSFRPHLPGGEHRTRARITQGHCGVDYVARRIKTATGYPSHSLRMPLQTLKPLGRHRNRW